MSETPLKRSFGFEIRLALLIGLPLVVIVVLMNTFNRESSGRAGVAPQEPPLAAVQGAPLIDAAPPPAPDSAGPAADRPASASADPRYRTAADLNPNIPLNVDIPPPAESGDGFRPVSFQELASYPYPRFPTLGGKDPNDAKAAKSTGGADGQSAANAADAANAAEAADAPAEAGAPATPAERIPAAVRALDGQSIAVNGFMVPIEVRNGKVFNFMLVRNQLACCFGAPLELNEWIDVTPGGERGVPYIKDVPVTVRGKLEVGEKSIDGWVMSVYRMESNDVRPAGGY